MAALAQVRHGLDAGRRAWVGILMRDKKVDVTVVGTQVLIVPCRAPRATRRASGRAVTSKFKAPVQGRNHVRDGFIQPPSQ